MREFDESLYFQTLQEKNYDLIVCDEVGRGPIAGPVVAASILIPSKFLTDKLLSELRELGVKDSKKLSEKKRQQILAAIGFTIEKLNSSEVLLAEISEHKIYIKIEEKSPKQIDESNILRASLNCMKEGALCLSKSCGTKKGIILIDGNQKFSWPDSSMGVVSLIKGDSKSLCIALASIIAKEFRDRVMKEMDKKFPGYGLKNNAGYPTKEHKEAVKELGVLPIHRKSFKGVKEFVQNL